VSDISMPVFVVGRGADTVTGGGAALFGFAPRAQTRFHARPQ